jgi:hypothetical protein
MWRRTRGSGSKIVRETSIDVRGNRDWNRKSNFFKIFFIDDQLDFESVSNFSRNDQHLANIGNCFGVRSAYM